MNINQLRKYFYDSKDFVIRFRDDKDIVYYNGIRAMNIIHPSGKDIKQEMYELIPDVYRVNKAFIVSERVRKDLKAKKYKDAEYFETFLSLRNNLMNMSNDKDENMTDSQDSFLRIIRNPKIVITRENHEQKDSLEDENRVLIELLKELEENNLGSSLKFAINKEFVLKDLSNVSYEKIEELRQTLSKLFNLDCNVFYKKRNWKSLKKENKDYQVKINKQDNYECIDNNLDIMEAHFVLVKEATIQEFQDIYISLSDLAKNNKAKELFSQCNYTFDDTIEICLNKDTLMDQILLIELLVLKHWILDEECNYIDTNKIHRKKPDAKILQSSKNFVDDLDEEKLNSILSKIKQGITHYELSKYEGEKNYQHQFMLDKKTVKKLNDKIHSDFLYPFEEEYYTSSSEDDNEKLGRIDSIFLDIHKDNNIDVYLIELKYNEQALGGTNGLHTHLNDIKNLFNKNTKIENFEKQLKENINNHLKIVHNMIPNTPLPSSINRICHYHFLIVIGYEKDKKDSIKNILKAYNDVNYYKSYPKPDNIPLPRVKNSKLTTLHELCKKIDKCDVKLFLDEINKTDNKVQITVKPLEEYELYFIKKEDS